MKQGLRFAAFTRVSEVRQAEQGSSLEVQRSQIQDAVAGHGGAVVRWYGGGAEHATPGWEKKEFSRMVRDCGTGAFNAIIVASSSRLTRTVREGAEALDVMKATQVEFYEGRTYWDIWNPSVYAALIVIMAGHQLSAQAQSAATNATRISRAKRGFPSAGTEPWARKLHNRKDRSAKDPNVLAIWKPDKDWREYAKQVADWRLKDQHTWEAIGARLLKDERYKKLHLRDSGGKPLPSAAHLANFWRRNLLNHSGTEWVQTFKERGKKVPITYPVPAILPDATIAAMRRDAETKMSARAPKRQYRLNKMCRCGECTSVLGASTATRDSKGRVYKTPIAYFSHPGKRKNARCVNRIRVELIEGAIVAKVSELLADTKGLADAIRRAIVGAEDELNAMKGDLSSVQRLLDEINKEVAAHMAAIGHANQHGPKTQAAWHTHMHELEAKQSSLEQRVAEIVRKVRALDAPEDLEKRVASMVAAITKPGRASFASWPYEAQARLLRWLFDQRRSLKTRDDVGIYISPLHGAWKRPTDTPFKWEAKGLFGNMRGAFVFGEEGGEHTEVDAQWSLGAKEVATLADIAVAFNLQDAPRYKPHQILSRQKEKKRSGGGGEGAAGSGSGGEAGSGKKGRTSSGQHATESNASV